MSQATATCRLCTRRELATPQEQQEGLCQTCSQGAPRLPPMARPLRPCAACGCTQVVRAMALERASKGSDRSTPYVAPLSIAFRWTGKHSWWTGSSVEVDRYNIPDTTGALELFICRACGLVAWYALNPAQIPIGIEWGTELHDVPTGDAPYR